MLRVENVTHRYQVGEVVVEALRDVNLEVRKSEFFTIIGPSGCGKSTLLNIIAGLIRPTAGRVFVNGTEVTRPLPGMMAYVFQQPLLLPWRTVLDNVAFGLEMMGVEKRERIKRAKEMLQLVGLQGFEKMYPSELSGGMQQRVSIARALVRNPRVLLMDEPFEGLGMPWLERVQEVVRALRSQGVAVVLAEQRLDLALPLADRVYVLEQGRTVYQGPSGDARTRERLLQWLLPL